jgi:lipopolysaccharide transport system ATP-binding protein
MSDDIAIRASGLGKTYQIYDRPIDRLKQGLWRGKKQFFREFHALSNVSLEVRRGESIGIIGRNGSGKSTLLQMIAGTLNPSSGSVEVSGRLAALLELGSGFNPEFTGRENVFMNGVILGLSHNEMQERFDEIATFAGIGDFMDQPTKTYSSGMVVRLAFAVSVCVEPEILIVDEALAVGDMAFQFKCMERLDQLTKSGTTLLFVSHDINAVKAFCSRALYLANGQVRGEGSASDMVELYLLDIRSEQKLAATNAAQVKHKPALGKDKAVAFGTDQGRIVQAYFMDALATEECFSTGDTICIQVDVEFDQTVTYPALNFSVTDHRLIEVGGSYCKITKELTADGMQTATVVFKLAPELNNGRYFITLRLEDRVSDEVFFPIDKQVAALSFQIMRPTSRYFSGLIDLSVSGTCAMPTSDVVTQA